MEGIRLWLFDIDGTLVDTGGAGLLALKEAATECFGGEGPELDLAGSTDSGIVLNMFSHFGLPHSDDQVERFYEFYLGRLEWNLAHAGFEGRVLPGAVDLLDQLAADEDATVGLLTGNIAGGAALKMRHYGLDHHFAFGAYGCDFADRNLLGPIALDRAAKHSGRSFSPEETLVIGDTPKDIACAHAMGSKCLAVATGKFSVDELLEAGADFALPGLSEFGI
ncbi:HAD family hydrolase [Haloferula chungangensis]|uniref:phosphoglycolate phosphatase n=1 Tax=Haloferula chungangensis TaxID=1048331 RepID=A0ABW2L7C0_9BACT